jgi:hypothetical protein
VIASGSPRRLRANRIITAIAGYYVAHSAVLIALAHAAAP